MMKKPRIIITVLLPKPAKAWSGVSSPVATIASMTPRATTSAAMRSHENSATAATRMARQVMICGVMRNVLPRAAACAACPRLNGGRR